MTARLSDKPLRRLAACMIGQAAKTRVCPDTPLLTDKVALITGATSGIGKETARGLLRRGAQTIMLCRNRDKAEVVVQEFIAEGLDARLMRIVSCDLAERASVAKAIDNVNGFLAGRRIDILIENAGIMLNRYEETDEGVEMTFATNVLGHFMLRHGLMEKALNRHARIIVLTGDIYIAATQCHPNFKWRGAWGGMKAYNRSKLGNFWIARELQRRHPELNVFIVHPGVVASNLGAKGGFLARRVKQSLLLDAHMGAQTSLLCATQADVSHGSYYHNVHGEAELNNIDPAMNDVAAARLYDVCAQMLPGDEKQNAPIRFAS